MRQFALVALLLGGCSAGGIPSESTLHFYEDVQSDVAAHCVGCHNVNGNLPASAPIFRADDTAEVGANYAAVMKFASIAGLDGAKLMHHDGDADLWRAWVSDGALK